MSADAEDTGEDAGKNKAGNTEPRPELDLSFLDRQPARATDIPNFGDHLERTDDNEPRRVSETKTLTVGRDISLKGDITECDSLIVEGRIEAKLDSARALEVSRGGRFDGSAKVETAIISGRFDGDLDVARALRITASGKVTGTVSYGRLEIENGGEVDGDVSIHR
ncbi:MAG: polymer-forming cytoskeletal protein [Alphaproteobacteria bacterium]